VRVQIGNMGCSGGCVGGCGMALSVAAVSVVVVGTGGSGGVFFRTVCPEENRPLPHARHGNQVILPWGTRTCRPPYIIERALDMIAVKC
jgi:hypothetical protein